MLARAYLLKPGLTQAVKHMVDHLLIAIQVGDRIPNRLN
jgi:hypothetical protein